MENNNYPKKDLPTVNRHNLFLEKLFNCYFFLFLFLPEGYNKLDNKIVESLVEYTFMELLTINEAAALLKLSKKSIYNRVHRREIPFIKLGKSLRFSEKHLTQWVNNNMIGLN